MYGLIGQIMTIEGKADALIEILKSGTRNMPGCIRYIISKDKNIENSIWITEIWDSETSHKNSLQLPSVIDAITRGRPMISGMGERFELIPVAGFE
jgi:quinol monooxygenase YgiN